VSENYPNQTQYRGRFAPSPTGPLHFGSLVSAVASYLQAKSRGGQWLVRMEDIDPPREPAGAADDILRTLETYALYWDESILYQSTRRDGYEEALLHLSQLHLTYPCTCSRKQIREVLSRTNKKVYPETCRGINHTRSPHAIRLKTEFQDIHITDGIQGLFSQNIREHVGDFVVKRADGYYAYQLAVVVDDAYQKITEIVRGSDLLDNAPRQVFLQQMLDFPSPQYVHIPIATTNGDKMSKQTQAPPIAKQNAVQTSVQVLKFLGQSVPEQWEFSTIEELWQWAIPRWDLACVPKVFSLEYSDSQKNASGHR
jgi:glutamyl-Q tRNA(Asp) synthetase